LPFWFNRHYVNRHHINFCSPILKRSQKWTKEGDIRSTVGQWNSNAPNKIVRPVLRAQHNIDKTSNTHYQFLNLRYIQRKRRIIKFPDKACAIYHIPSSVVTSIRNYERLISLLSNLHSYALSLPFAYD
jgi:hypothetical protein